MKTFILGIILLSLTTAAAQDMRYFQFTTSCGHGNWQDTAYIAATNDPAIISDVYAELGKPFDDRKFVAGKIDYGHGGYNHNASHWFLWHYIPNQWQMAEVAMEVCDGCPYTDLDADTAYWVRNIQQYCSWGGRPVKEVPKPTGIHTAPANTAIYYYPNPAKDKLHIDGRGLANTTVLAIYTIAGKEVLREKIPAGNTTIDISALTNGLYFTRLGNDNAATYGRLIVE